MSTHSQSTEQDTVRNADQKTVFIFRHGETDWNLQRRLQGNTDIPLNQTGRSQAAKLTDFFRLNPVDIFLSSDLSRARETAEIAKGELDVSVVLDPGLRETNLGQAEGLTHPEIIERFGAHAWEAWYDIGPNGGHFRFPGGETKTEHLQRVLGSLERFLRETNHSRIGVASHGGVIRRLIHHLRPELTDPVMVSNCSVYELGFDVMSGLWSVDLEVKCAW